MTGAPPCKCALTPASSDNCADVSSSFGLGQTSGGARSRPSAGHLCRTFHFGRGGPDRNGYGSCNAEHCRSQARALEGLAESRAALRKTWAGRDRGLSSEGLARAEAGCSNGRLDRQLPSDRPHRLRAHADPAARVAYRHMQCDCAGDDHREVHAGGEARQPAEGRALHAPRLGRDAELQHARLDRGRLARTANFPIGGNEWGRQIGGPFRHSSVRRISRYRALRSRERACSRSECPSRSTRPNPGRRGTP